MMSSNEEGQGHLFDPLQHVSDLIQQICKENPEIAQNLTTGSGIVAILDRAMGHSEAKSAIADAEHLRQHRLRIAALYLGYVFGLIVFGIALAVSNEGTRQNIAMAAVGGVFGGGGFALGRSTKDRRKDHDS